MMRKILFPSLLFLLAACNGGGEKITRDRIEAVKTAGNFSEAKHLIDLYIAQDSLSQAQIYDLYAEKDTMDRIAIDFKRTRPEVIEYIKKYYPDVNDTMMAKWEANKSLEWMMIDGEERYFKRAAQNLFRLDADAKAKKLQVDGVQVDKSDEVLKTHLPEVVASLAKSGKTQATPVKMKVRYTLTLNANAIPVGEVVRCWLPYPREDNRRQTNVQLLSVNSDTYLISPASYAHRTLYVEKTTEKDKPLEFAVEFSYASAPEWFNLTPEKVKPYDVNS